MIRSILQYVFDRYVRRETQGAVAEGHGVAERHDSADDGPGHPFMLF